MRRWVPAVSYRTLSPGVALDLGLDNSIEWKALVVEWFGYAYVLYVTPE